MNRDEAKLLQVMSRLVRADEIDLMEGLAELGDLFPKLKDWDSHDVLGKVCQQVGTLLRRNELTVLRLLRLRILIFSTVSHQILSKGPARFSWMRLGTSQILS